MTDKTYDKPNIRKLLINGFSDQELRRLYCEIPDFYPVCDDLSHRSSKSEIVDQLIEYADRTLQIDTLLDLAKEQRPERYDFHGPYYEGESTEAHDQAGAHDSEILVDSHAGEHESIQTGTKGLRERP